MKPSLEEMELRIDFVRRVACPASWAWDSLNQNWRGLHLWAVASGRGSFRTPAEGFKLRRGQCFALRPPERYIGSHDPERPLVVLTSTFRFFDPASGALWTPSPEELPLHRDLEDFGFLEALYGRCLSAWESRRESEAVHWLKAILVELRSKAPSRNAAADTWLRRAALAQAARIRESPGEEHSLSSVAKALGRSKNQALRVFRSCVGSTPGELLRAARLDAAKSLLLYSSLSVKEIAAQLGYCDQFAFSKQFKARCGMAPSRFRASAPSPSA